jgi:predicted phage baseplate assembly protein
MSETTASTQLHTCGCCQTGVAEPAHANRPGLSSLNYRIGTHGTLLRRMLARLSQQEIPDGDNAGQRPLAALSTRSTADPAIALLDAWATTADVLTFYQERIANEGYLRTATERRSVLELARAIGYELNPGVAASTYLAFMVDDSASTPDRATVKAGTQIQSIPAKEGELPQTFETSTEFEARVEWNTLHPRTTERDVMHAGKTELYLAGIDTQLQPGDALLIVGPERQDDPTNERWDVRILKTVETFPKEGYTLVTWEEGLGFRQGGTVLVEPAADETAEVYVLRQRASLFGYNAPDWRTMSLDVKKAYKGDVTDDPATWGEEWPNFALGQGNDPALPQIDLDAIYSRIVGQTWMVLEQPNYVELYKVKAVSKAARSDFAITAKTARVTLEGENLENFTAHRRDTVVYAQPEKLKRAEKPLTTRVEKNTIELDRLVEGLAEGQPLIVHGKLSEDDTDETREVAFVASTATLGNRTTLVLQDALEHSYVRSTVTTHANVVPATHGETVAGEVLGSGDGAQAHQRFRLKRSPPTYVSAETVTGTESTLQVRVNGVLWEQVPSLYGLSPAAETYIVRIDNDAEATVSFGDGKSGARLPTGQENVQATYRFGLGSVGEVGADTLSLLKKRPFGVRSVTNPLPASGAADPEKLANARTNAPLTVLTLERIVSLQDFEDFARAFAGIGKAQAIALWVGETTIVHLTVADDDGDPVPKDVCQKLHRAIDNARDPVAEVQIDNYALLTFNVKASVLFDARYLDTAVQAEIEQALLEAFSFERRAFGQPVTAAELLSVMHQVDGVIAVDLDALSSEEASPSAEPAAVLPARTARRENGQILPAQLVLINPAGITLTMRST